MPAGKSVSARQSEGRAARSDKVWRRADTEIARRGSSMFADDSKWLHDADSSCFALLPSSAGSMKNKNGTISSTQPPRTSIGR